MHELGIWVESFHIHSPNASRNKLKAPGMNGVHLTASTMDVRQVSITLQIETDNMLEFDVLKHRIYDMFYTKIPFSIIRGNLPDRELFVIQEGSYDVDNITGEDGTFEIPLSMLDPFLYGPERTTTLTGNGTIINVAGTAPTKPIFEFDVLAPITFAMVSNGSEYMMIGNPTAVEETPVNKSPKIFHNYMRNQIGWVDFTNVLEGYTNGTVANSDDNVYPVFSTPQDGRLEWNGPAKKHSLFEPVQDFRAEMWVHFLSDSVGRTGRIEMYLMNSLNEAIGIARIEDRWHGYDQLVCQLILAGGRETPPIMLPPRLEDFQGNLKVERVGDEWTLTVQKLRYEDRVQQEWESSVISENNTDEISQIGHTFQRFYDDKGADMDIYSMRLYKYIDAVGTPYIAQAGDKLLFDFKNHDIRINGEVRKDLKDRGATPFALKPGDNPIVLLPDSELSGVVMYRPAYK